MMTLLRQLPNELQVGSILLYTLRAEDLPTHPEKIWHGLIKHILVDIADSSQPRYYLVQSIEYPDCEELVHPTQVTSNERQQLI
jgi:hypothetical protein